MRLRFGRHPVLAALVFLALHGSLRAQESITAATLAAPTATTPFASGDLWPVIENDGLHSVLGSLLAPINSPNFTGSPAAPTPATGDNSTRIPTTAWVNNQAYAPLASPALTGTPTAPTPPSSDSSTRLATTAYVQSNIRLRLGAPLTLYISPSGTDSGACTSISTPCQTLQYAYNTALATYDLNNQQLTIQLLDGTYSAGLTLAGQILGQATHPVIIQGDTSTPTNVIVSASSAADFTSGTGSLLQIQYLEVKSSGSNNCLAAVNGTIFYQSITFAGCGNADVIADQGGRAYAMTGSLNTITSGAAYHFESAQSSYMAGCGIPSPCTVVLTGTPAFSGAFADAYDNGELSLGAITFSGSGTGARYTTANGGVIDAEGQGASYLPGNAAGTPATACTTTATGGVYC